MQLRYPLDIIAAIGALTWPVGYVALGGFDQSAGATVIGVGSLLTLSAFVIEAALRARHRHRATRGKPD